MWRLNIPSGTGRECLGTNFSDHCRIIVRNFNEPPFVSRYTSVSFQCESWQESSLNHNVGMLLSDKLSECIDKFSIYLSILGSLALASGTRPTIGSQIRILTTAASSHCGLIFCFAPALPHFRGWLNFSIFPSKFSTKLHCVSTRTTANGPPYCIFAGPVRNFAISSSQFVSQTGYKRKNKESTFTTQFLAVTRAIIHRPDLAQSIRIVDINLGRNFNNQRLILQGLDLSEFQAAGLNYFTDMTRWEPTLPWSDHGASRASIDVYPHVCMLLSFLPKLENLRMRCDSVSSDIHCITDLVERLQNLREITTLFPGRHEVKFHCRELVLLLSLPRLRILKLKGLNMRSMSSKPYSLLPGSLGIKQLSLRQCTTRDSRMQELITSCKKLTNFTYTKLSEDAGKDPNPEPWHTALSLHKGSLLELNLNLLDKQADDSDNGPRPAWPSFWDFSTLKSLKVDYRRVRLSGLPKSLETLKLSNC
jgi:hypothetical protein